MSAAPVHVEPALFVWPPAKEARSPVRSDLPSALDDANELLGTPATADRATTNRARLAGVASSLESDLLGVRAASFRRWADAIGWTRDAAGSFCWRCAGTVGPYECDGGGCADCRGKRLAWNRALRLGRYESGLRAGVMELKFGRWRRTGREIGRELGSAIAGELASGGVRPEEAVLVPVPMSWRRRMGRGIDHTGVLARAASGVSGVPVLRLLVRAHRRQQVGLSATARAANVRGSFIPARRSGALPGRVRVVIVLDDVRTTGATMTAACRAIRPLIGSSPEVWGAVACVADERDGPEGSGAAFGAAEGAQ